MAESEFAGKRALVTGAGKGIGRACVKALREAGAAVFALSRTQSDLDSLKSELPEVHTICADVCNWNATKELIQKALPIDLLVNNAGVTFPESFLTMSEESYDRTMTVNTKAAFQISQLIANDMVERKCAGSIVNVSSVASEHRFIDHTAYCMSKAAMDALTKIMAVELGPYNIRTNSVNPTVVMTAMGVKAWSEPTRKKGMLDQIPLGRFAEEEDVIVQILHLLSGKSSMLNGVTLVIDGGFLAH
ncbi:L-xylulose reductase-like [Tubulanus polymorphus]|uniref:L-xylulose reductase-like n=1 Tax=Tubulanus polymorphus TaxID=672921 RepID=UPI003DA69B43